MLEVIHVRRSRLLLVVTFLAVLSGGLAQTALAAPLVWVVGSLERVRPDTAPGASSQAGIDAAAGEYESFQLVVRAGTGNLTNVNVIAPTLTGPGSAQISPSNITLYREHYVYYGRAIRGGDNLSDGPGWYPDALIPFVDPETGQDITGATYDAAPFAVAAGSNQPVWVDVFVPRGTSSGEFTGTFTITSDQGNALVDLRLTVWDFELPLTPSFKSSFGISDPYPEKGEELLRNRLMPRTTRASDQPAFMAQYGLNCTNTGFYSNADSSPCEMDPAPSIAAFQAEADNQQPGLFLYDYSADEIGGCASLYETIKEWGRNMHAAGLNQLITMAPTPELYDDDSGTGRSAVDIWVVLPKMYDAAPDEVQEVLAKGDEVWSYNALLQDDYSPKWMLDFSPLNFRLQPGFISQSLGLSGLLYWRVDYWPGDPWTDPNGYSELFPGEGQLLYPGAPAGLDGVCPSMRLKWLRDGVEDYEYIALLAEQGAGEAARAIARTVGENWANWTHDPAALEAARRQLGGMFARTFTDVPPGYWAYSAIQVAYQAGVVTGYPDGSYQPALEVNRAAMAVFIARSIVTPTGEAGLVDYVPPETPSFPDVPADFWSYKHIEYLKEQHIVGGYPDGKYRPSVTVNRAQMAVFIARAIVEPPGEDGLAGYTPPTSPTFADVPPVNWAYTHIEYLAGEGVVQGYPDGLYHPQRTVTRDQMAVYVARAFGLW